MDEMISIPEIDMISAEGATNIEEVFPSFSFSSFVNDIAGGQNVFDMGKIYETLLRIISGEVYTACRVLAVVGAVILLGALLENLKQSFGKTGFNASNIACIAVIVGLSANLFSRAYQYAFSVTDDMALIMASLLPIFVTLLAGSGFSLTGSITHPIILAMCNIFSTIFERVLIPAAVIYLVIMLLNTLSDSVELGGLGALVKKCYNFIVGIVMTLFTGVLSLSGFAAVSLDGLGARGAKFAISSMVPFVGGSISDAMGAVASASIVLKNAVGTAGIIVIALLCIVPIVKIGLIVLALRVCAAVCEPVANAKTIKALSVIGDSLSMINAAVISTAVMMIIAMSVIVGVK